MYKFDGFSFAICKVYHYISIIGIHSNWETGTGILYTSSIASFDQCLHLASTWSPTLWCDLYPGRGPILRDTPYWIARHTAISRYRRPLPWNKLLHPQDMIALLLYSPTKDTNSIRKRAFAEDHISTTLNRILASLLKGNPNGGHLLPDDPEKLWDKFATAYGVADKLRQEFSGNLAKFHWTTK